MDTQLVSHEKFVERSRRLVPLLSSDTFADTFDTFDVNELSMDECNVLMLMTAAILWIIVHDLFSDVDAAVPECDDTIKYFVQFFRRTPHAMRNCQALVEKVIDEYTASHESWSEDKDEYDRCTKTLLVSLRDTINGVLEATHKR